MSALSYYEINVSKDKVHLFATAPRSLSYESEARELFDILKKKFPESEGFAVSAYHYQNSGTQVFSNEKRTPKPIQARTLPPVQAFTRADEDDSPEFGGG